MGRNGDVDAVQRRDDWTQQLNNKLDYAAIIFKLGADVLRFGVEFCRLPH